MWISSRKWEALEKRIAGLEAQIQSQPKTELDGDAILKLIQEQDLKVSVNLPIRKKTIRPE